MVTSGKALLLSHSLSMLPHLLLAHGLAQTGILAAR